MATNNEELLHVNEDLRGIYTELFLGDDSDEDFEGFHLEDIESSDSDTNLDSWEIGDREPSTLNFTGTRGLQAHLPENPEIIDFVKLFLNDGDFKIISEETNRYASSYLQQAELRSHSRLKRWPTDGVTCDDVKCFIALTIAMGLTVQEDLGEYWSTDPIMQTPFYPSIMSRDFFMNILSFLHLSDNRNYIPRGQRGYNPLFKLGEVYDNILTRFKTVWYPGQHVCIDEGMIPFRGKVHMRVYAPDKPDKYGLKSYELCDSENAYCCVFRLYTGKTEQAVSKHGKTYDLVMSLMHDYLRKGHILYIDNYYTSPQLLMDLHKKGTGATGTARNRKGFPPAVRDAKLSNKGDKIVMSNGPMMAMKIKDRKDVKMLSTVHSSTDVDTAKRNHRGVAIRRCEAVHMYNQFMGAVDRNDQMVAYSSFRRRTLKWWKKVFFHVLSLAILNSWIVYRDWCQSKRVSPVLQRVFRKEYVRQLLNEVQVTPADKTQHRTRCLSDLPTRLNGHHYPSKVPPGEKKKNRTRKCAVCFPGERAIRQMLGMAAVSRPGRESSYECVTCAVGLCVDPCFKLYHTNKDFISAYKRHVIRKEGAENGELEEN